MTLSKLKEEGREEAVGEILLAVENALQATEKANFGVKDGIELYNKVESILTVQIEKAYHSALSDVEKGLPERMNKESVDSYLSGNLRNRVKFRNKFVNGHNQALSAVKEVISKLKEKHE